jgi:aspartyl-tRNA(Asn)/glutamyl-tRNA(Gln) amidotransferase subunit A
MTRTVRDAALMLGVLAGPDERDPSALPAAPVDYVKALGGSLEGLRVAYSDTLGFAPAVEREVREATAGGARVFRKFGCKVEFVDPGWPSPYECWRAIFLGGIATRLAPYLAERRQDIDPGLVPVIEEALGWSPTRYVEAWFERLAWQQHARAFFERYDLLLSPTVACPPFRIGMLYPAVIDGKQVGREASSAFTFPFNMTGQPAASVPCGLTKDGRPIGLQVVGRRFDDVTVLRACAAFERARPWGELRPPLDPARPRGASR